MGSQHGKTVLSYEFTCKVIVKYGMQKSDITPECLVLQLVCSRQLTCIWRKMSPGMRCLSWVLKKNNSNFPQKDRQICKTHGLCTHRDHTGNSRNGVRVMCSLTSNGAERIALCKWTKGKTLKSSKSETSK